MGLDRYVKIVCSTDNFKITMPEVMSRSIDVVSESITIPFTQDEIQARFLAVDIEIVDRTADIGTSDFSKYIPRIWSGYWYLTNNESISQFGAIQFARQRIYQNEFPGTRKLANLTAELMGIKFALAESGGGLLDELGEPILNPYSDLYGQLKLAYYSVMTAIADNLDCGFSLAQPVSDLRIYCPVGAVFKVTIRHQAYCDLVRTDDGETLTPVGDNPNKPIEPANPPLNTAPPPGDFDDIARDRGYIPAIECPSVPENPYDDNPEPPNYSGVGTATLSWSRLASTGQTAGLTDQFSRVKFPIQGYSILLSDPLVNSQGTWHKKLDWRLVDGNGVVFQTNMTISSNVGYRVLDSVVQKTS